jgi:tetratricopeptide (TPR) repeat protein
MTDTATAGREHLRQAEEAFAAALRALEDPAIVPEDRPLDPGLVAQALVQFNNAAEAFAGSGEPTLEAQARLGLAEVQLRSIAPGPDVRTRLTQLEQSARAALERLDCAKDPALALRALLVLAEAGRYLADGVPESRETRLISTAALLDGASYIAHEQGDPAIARVHAETCRVLSERFDGERDEHLLDAIAHGELAIESFRRGGNHSFELASLLMHLGNCCLKAAGDRAHWLAQGRDWYREGAAIVDAVRYPRLYRMLNEHSALADKLIESKDFTLPEKEMVARYASGINAALKKQDAEKARRLGFGFLNWSWSLPATPNVHIGEAHKAIARIAIVRGDWDDAQQHLYHSVGLLTALLSQRDRWYYLVGEARELFKQALERNGAGASIDLWLQRAAGSFIDADAACKRGAGLIESNTAAALPEFDQALNIFPCHPAAHFYRGVARAEMGNLAGAIADYDFTLMLTPRNMPAYGNRGVTKLALGDPNGALADLEEALKIAPDNTDLQRMRATILERHLQRPPA